MTAALGLGGILMLFGEYVAQGFLAGSLSARALEPLVLSGVLGAHVALSLGTGLLMLAVRESPRLPGPGLGLHKRLFAGALFALPAGAWLGARLAAGEWVAAQPFAWVVQVLLPLLLLGAVSLVIWLAGRFFGRPWFHAAAAFAAMLLVIVNVTFLPGLYLEAHLFLYAVSLGSSLLAASWLLQLSDGSFSRWVIRGFAVVAVFAWAALPFGLGKARPEVVRSSPGVGAVFAVVVPPLGTDHLKRELLRASELLPSGLEAPETSPALAEPARSVLWVVVDTLRGDALPPVRDGDESFVEETDTPHLNRWLSGAYRFENAYSQASQTKRSIPPMFRSLRAFENPSTNGIALGHYARSLGLKPIAVVPQYFLMPAQPRSQALLEGFESVEIFEKDRQETMLPQTGRLLSELKGTPFLAWVHFYNMHHPYFTGRQQDGEPLSRAESYGQALRWLDGRFGELLKLLNELDLAKDTIVVLASDHGEQLGEGKRTGHGSGLTEGEIRAPLAIHVPGTKGGLVKALVGNVDILPTLLELLGRPADSSHRGESMVGLMGESASSSERLRYSVSGNGRFHGLVSQETKLVYARKLGSFSLFSRIADPHDQRDLLGVDPFRDARLISFMVQSNPGLFAAELKDAEVRALLRQELRTVGVQGPSRRLEFLLKAASVANNKRIREEALNIFERGESVDVKLMVFRHLAGVEAKAWGTRWKRVLTSHAGKPSELALVRGLASQKFIGSASSVFLKRLKAVSRGADGDLLDAWLELIEHWKGKSPRYAPVFLSLAEVAAKSPVNTARLTTLLLNVGTLRRPKRDMREPLEEIALTALSSGEPQQRVAACRALGVVAGKEGSRELKRLLHEPGDPRVRQAAMHALLKRRKEGALADVTQAGEDPLLTADAIVLLRRLGDPAALPFLSEVASHHYNRWTRKQAAAAIKAIKRKGNQ